MPQLLSISMYQSSLPFIGTHTCVFFLLFLYSKVESNENNISSITCAHTEDNNMYDWCQEIKTLYTHIPIYMFDWLYFVHNRFYFFFFFEKTIDILRVYEWLCMTFFLVYLKVCVCVLHKIILCLEDNILREKKR